MEGLTADGDPERERQGRGAHQRTQESQSHQEGTSLAVRVFKWDLSKDILNGLLKR